MSKPYDATLKDLIADYPADWLRFLGLPAPGVEVIDSDLSTVTAASDKVLKVLDAEPWLLHAELQSSPRTDPDEQLHWYNTLIRHRHRMRVRSALILLRREADSPRLTGVYRVAFPGEPPYLEFRYDVVRVWRTPADTFLGGGLGLLPLAPLADVTEDGLPAVLGRMAEQLRHEARPEVQAELWTAAYVLTGMRLEPAALATLFQGVRLMHESSAYQLIMAEGAVAELKKVLLRQGTRKFGGPPSTEAAAALEAMTDLPRLERMTDCLFDAVSWDDLLATP
jgi:hypothetical protein